MNNLFQSVNANNIQNFKNQLSQLQRRFQGNPRDQIMQMLNRGQITQEQLNNAQSKATQILKLING